MGDRQDLPILGQKRQALTDRRGGRTADTGVDFVKDERGRFDRGGQHDLECQHEAAELTARGDLV